MNTMVEKLAGLGPEITLLIGACVCLFLGLLRSAELRKLAAWAAGAALIIASIFIVRGGAELGFVGYIKLAVCLIGLILLLVAAGVPDRLRTARDLESGVTKFDPALTLRGEFFAFFLFSLTGVMLSAGAGDLVWLFLALELTSLPTYVMVATSRDRVDAQEAAVKYFFLGAMAAAVFLYGFTLIYGATGQTEFGAIRDTIAANGASPLFITGLVLAIGGIAFKIAAVPMHFYAADVYQGSPTPVTAFLAFVPKTAGFVSIMLLIGLLPDGDLPPAVSWLIWIMAALTMTVGNVLGLLQSNVKRVLAYSSVAHTGYMLVGLIAIRGFDPSRPIGNGAAAVLFYLIAYGLSTIAAFAVLGCLETRGEEAQEFDDISGLARSRPVLATILVIAVLSLVGLPPMVGFIGKIYLFGSAIAHSEGHPEYIWLVVIAVLNSAISAVYYLRIIAAAFFGEPARDTQRIPGNARPIGAAIAAILAIVLGFSGGWLVSAAQNASMKPTNIASHESAQSSSSVAAK